MSMCEMVKVRRALMIGVARQFERERANSASRQEGWGIRVRELGSSM